jgi:CO/xanthine dehydrogenase FAD-binding subunit
MRAREFFVDVMTTAREPDELVTALVWPRAGAATRHAFAEIAQRHGDFAIVACAVAAEIDASGVLRALSLGLGGVESRPLVADTAGFLGERADRALADAIAAAAAERVDPLNDHKASASYRRALVRTLGAQVLAQAFGAEAP